MKTADPEATRAALGAGFVLMASVFGSIALAFALSLTIGGIYIPFLMPVVVGLLLGTIGSFVARRFQLLEKRPVVLAALLGATIAYTGYHVLAYLRVLERLAVGWAPELALGPGVDPTEAALAVIEQATGQSGYFAYLAFVSKGSGVVYSPLGLFARGEPGATASLIVMVVELLLANATAVWAMLWRTRAQSRDAILTRIDEATLAPFLEALEGGDWIGAGKTLASSGPDVAFAVTLDAAGGAVRLAVVVVDPFGKLRETRAQRTIGEAQLALMRSAMERAR